MQKSKYLVATDRDSVWGTTVTTVGYEEIYAALMMSMDINGFDAAYKDVLTQAFKNANMI